MPSSTWALVFGILLGEFVCGNKNKPVAWLEWCVNMRLFPSLQNIFLVSSLWPDLPACQRSMYPRLIPTWSEGKNAKKKKSRKCWPRKGLFFVSVQSDYIFPPHLSICLISYNPFVKSSISLLLYSNTYKITLRQKISM